jgi:hypothetical protein
MIDESDYRLPRKQQPEQNNKKKKKANTKTLTYLESLPWRPFDMEW